MEQQQKTELKVKQTSKLVGYLRAGQGGDFRFHIFVPSFLNWLENSELDCRSLVQAEALFPTWFRQKTLALVKRDVACNNQSNLVDAVQSLFNDNFLNDNLPSLFPEFRSLCSENPQMKKWAELHIGNRVLEFTNALLLLLSLYEWYNEFLQKKNVTLIDYAADDEPNDIHVICAPACLVFEECVRCNDCGHIWYPPTLHILREVTARHVNPNQTVKHEKIEKLFSCPKCKTEESPDNW